MGVLEHAISDVSMVKERGRGEALSGKRQRENYKMKCKVGKTEGGQTMFKRGLACFLSAIMLCSSMPANVWAEDVIIEYQEDGSENTDISAGETMPETVPVPSKAASEEWSGGMAEELPADLIEDWGTETTIKETGEAEEAAGSEQATEADSEFTETETAAETEEAAETEAITDVVIETETEGESEAESDGSQEELLVDEIIDEESERAYGASSSVICEKPTVSGTMKAGDTITCTPHVTGGTGVYAYNYWLFDSTGAIVLRKENTFDTTWTFTAPKAGIYLLRTYATDFSTEHYNDTDWFAISGNDVNVESISLTGEAKEGCLMKVKPTVSGGSGTYAYNYWLFDSNGTIVLRKENTFDKEWSFNAPKSGVYLMRVYATDFTSEHYTDTSWFYIEENKVTVAPVAVTNGIKGGTSMRITPTVSGGSGTYAYNYWLFDSTGNIVQRVENTFASSVNMTMPSQSGVYLVRVYATDFTTEAYNDSAWFWVNQGSCLDAPTLYGWQEDRGTVYLDWSVDEPADAYVVSEVINGEAVYLSSTGEQYVELTGVTPGIHRYQVCAAMLENGSWVYGERAEISVRVYAYEDAQTPIMYIEKSEGSGAPLGWFEVISFVVGTTTSLDKVDGDKFIRYKVEFLKDDAVVAECIPDEGLYMSFYEDKVQFGWSDTSIWKQAYDQQAEVLRIRLLEDENGEYLLDSERSEITLSLEKQSETAGNPKVNCTYDPVAEVGVPQTLVFQSENPSDLTEANNTVRVWRDEEFLGEAKLTADAPKAEFSYIFANGGDAARFEFEYTYGDKTVHEECLITASLLEEFFGTEKLRRGNIGWWSPGFWGERLDVSYASSDENVITVEKDSDGDAEVLAVGAGCAVITVTTPGGNTLSGKVVVYDPDDLEVPELYLELPNEEEKVNLYNFLVGVGTTTDLVKIASSIGMHWRAEFLDENDQVLMEARAVQWMDFYTEPVETERIYANEISRAYYMGARKIRVTILPDEEENYTIAEGRETVVLSMQDLKEMLDKEEEPVCTAWYPSQALPGEQIEVGVICLNPDKISGEKQITIASSEGTALAQGVLTSANAEVKTTVTLPENEADWNFYAYDTAETIYVDGSVSIMGADMSGEVLTVGEGVYMSAYFWHSSEEAVSYESSDPEVAEVNEEGFVTGRKEGLATITVTRGRTVVSAPVRVYDPDTDHVTPNVYIKSAGGIQWFDEAMPLIIGTKTDVAQIGGPLLLEFEVTFWKNGNEIPLNDTSYALWGKFLNQETKDTLRVNNSLWAEALDAQATEIKVELQGTDKYNVEPGQDTIVYSLPDTNTVDYPVILYSVPNVLEAGQGFKAVFECINPEKLREDDNTVEIRIGEDSREAVLSVENPKVEFSFEGLNEDTWVTYSFPVTANGVGGGGTTIEISSLESIGNDVRMEKGSFLEYAPEFSGASFALNFKSSNEAVVRVAVKEYGIYELTAVDAGHAVITATTPAGIEKSINVYVYNPASAEPPVIYLEEAEAGDVAGWEGIPVNITTTTELEKLGGLFPLTVKAEFLDDAGNTVRTAFNNSYVLFDASPTMRISLWYYDDMMNAHYNGAKTVRLTLQPSDDGEYKIDAEKNQVVELPMAELAAADTGTIVRIYPEEALPGDTVKIGVVYWNANEENEISQVRIYGDDGNLLKEGKLGKDNFAVLTEVTIPKEQEYGYEFRISLGYGGDTDEYWLSGYIPLLGGTMSNEMVAIEEKVQMNAYFWNSLSGEKIVYSSSAPQIARVDETGEVTGVSEGTAEITAAAGEIEVTAFVRVYNPAKTYETPTVYIEGKGTEAGWLENYPFLCGTDSQLEAMGGRTYCSVLITTEYLKDGQVIYSDSSSLYFKFAALKQNMSEQVDEAICADAFLAGANQVRLTLTENNDCYKVDPARSEVVYSLPAKESYKYPIVSYTCPDVVEPGQEFEVVFTCLNPENLVNGSNEVSVELGAEEKVTEYLSAEKPSVTIRISVPKNTSGMWIMITRPVRNYLGSNGFWVSVSELQMLGEDSKINVGGCIWIYPRFSGGSLELTYESSDESVAAFAYDEYGIPTVKGIAKGTAVITATTPLGNQKSFTVTVTD